MGLVWIKMYVCLFLPFSLSMEKEHTDVSLSLNNTLEAWRTRICREHHIQEGRGRGKGERSSDALLKEYAHE